MKKKSYLTVTDMFCGAGGSSQGIRRIAQRNGGGIEVKLAMNHWKLAIQTHEANFPDADHDCADISASDPRRYNSTDILIASPECTNHSLAKNKKHVKKQFNMFETQQQMEDRSRATMWDVPRFAEYHGYNCIVTENVVDAKRWIQYPAWIQSMQLLGYDYKECYLNSKHFPPTPQSRDRMYVVFWKKKNKAPKLDYTPLAWCAKCEKDVHSHQSWKPGCMAYGKYETQYVYRCSCGHKVEPYYYAAMNCIDWTIPSERVGSKKRKLSPNTRNRIQIGIDKFWSSPFVIYGGDNSNYNKGKATNDRSYPITGALPTQAAQPWHQLISPFIAYACNNHGKAARISKGTDALGTQCTVQDAGVVMPPIPFITNSAYGGKTKEITDAMLAMTAQQNYDLIQMPFQIEMQGKSTARSLTDALNTQMSIAKNCVITNDAWQSFIGYYYGNAYESQLTDALGTCTTKERHYLATFEAGKKIEVDDCYYRMIRAKEVGRAMAFDDTYIVFGDERDQVRQYGNAVTPPVMEWLANQCVESLR